MDYLNKKTRPRIMDLLEAEQNPDVPEGAPASQPGKRPRIMDLLENSLKNKDRTLLSTAGDVAVTGAKAVVGMGESLAGLADLIPGISPSGRPSFGLAGKALESLGWDAKKTHEILETLYSPKQKAANLRVQQAEGFVNTVKEAIKNPSTIVHSTLESLPIMFGGAGIARFGLSKAPLLLKAYPKLAPLIAGAMGEGLVSMGMAAEQNRQETPDGLLTAKQAAINVGSGFGTGAFALAGGRLAMKLGLTDVDTLMAGGRFTVGTKGVIKRILGGGLSEGVFEELPQSMQEQIWANAALDRPLLQGVGEAGAQGMLAGGLMGMGAGIVPGKPDLKEVEDKTKKKTLGGNLRDQLNAWSKSRETDPLGEDDVAKDIIDTVGGSLTPPPDEPPGTPAGPDIAQLSAFEALQMMLEGKAGRLVKQKYKWKTNKEPAAGEPFMILGDEEDPAATITKHTGINDTSFYRAFVNFDGALESIGMFSTPEQASTFAQDAIEEQAEQGEPQYDAGAMQPQADEFAEPLAAFAAGLEGEPIAPEPLAEEEEVPSGEAPPKIPPTVDELRAEKERRADKYRQRKASDATTLRSFLNALGGVNINDPSFKGEFDGIRWDVSDKGKKVLAKGFPRGFWNKQGRTLDTLVTDAIEAGWLPADSTDEDLLNAITKDLRIKHTQVEATVKPEADDREQRLAAELEDEAQAAEPPPPEEEHPPEVTPDFEDLVKKAQAWKGAAIAADRLYDKEDKKARLKHSQITTKGDLDAFLMKEYDLDEVTARSVSNQLTKDNLPPDQAINLEDYKGEPWADAALNYKKPEADVQAAAGIKSWRDLETGDVFFDELNDRHLKVLAKGLDRKGKAIGLAESKGGEVWIDHNNTWAVVAVTKPGTEYHDVAFIKEHRTKEQLDKMYHEQVKQIEGRMEPDQAKRAKMMSDLKSAYKIESEKYAKTEAPKAKQGYDYSSTQVNLPDQAANTIKAYGEKIPDDELYIDPEDPSSGREDEPHVTVRYGIDTADAADVSPAFEGLAPITVKLGKVSIFTPDEKYDVVKIDIESPDLQAANKRVGETVALPGETYKDYKPHATIAYVKKGEGEKYVGDTFLEGQEFTINAVTFSSKTGKSYEIPLTGKPTVAEPEKAPKADVKTAITPEATKPLVEPQPKKASEMTAAEMMAEWDKQVAELPEAPVEPKAPEPPAAKQKADEAKQHLQNAFDKFKQINAILDKKGAIGPELDQGTWEQILPLLKEAFSEILSAGKSGAEFVSLSIQNLSQKGRPYFEKFVNEEMKAKEAPSAPGELEPLVPEEIEATTNEAAIAETKDLMMTELMANGDTAVYKALVASLKVLEAQGKPISEVKAPAPKEKVSRETSRPGSPQQLKKIKVDRALVDENGDQIMTKDGKVFTQPESAFDAFNDIDSRLDIYKELIDCL